MNRLEQFRQKRSNRKKYLISVLFFVFLLTAGLIAVDSSTNMLMTGHRGIAMFRLENGQNDLDVYLFNRKLHFNMKYINRDLKRLHSKVNGMLGE